MNENDKSDTDIIRMELFSKVFHAIALHSSATKQSAGEWAKKAIDDFDAYFNIEDKNDI